MPDDLAQHRCIASALFPVWPYNVKGRRVEVAVRGPLVLTGGDAVREAALLGLGIAQSNWWTVHHDIARGALIESNAIAVSGLGAPAAMARLA